MALLADIMTSLVTSVVGAVGGLLCAPLYNKIKASMYVLNAPESFPGDVEKLSALTNDVRGMSSSDDTEKWLSEADKITKKAREVLLNQGRSSGQNHGLRLLCCTFINHGISRCKLHKKVKELTLQGQNIKTCHEINRVRVEHIPGVPNIEDGSTAEKNLKKVMDMLNDDEVWCIGVWGPGGVGKTTLVDALNNKLENPSSCSFSWVRSIPLLKDVDETMVQKAIAEKLKLDVEGTDTREITVQIKNRLEREKFLLILDNLWVDINLARIGIPVNQTGSKVVLTTRLEKVCTEMKAKAKKIGYLNDTEAWKLFVEKAGDVVNNEGIQPLAKTICGECGGLPLALVAVGSAMSGETNIHRWRSAADDLRNSVFPEDVEAKVYKPLKLSFDFLANDTLKSCFLYCSLYPEGYEIKVSELVQCLLAENIIDVQLYYQNAYSKGIDLIEKLKNSSLLLQDPRSGDCIKLHDVVRDVAIQIGKSNGTTIVISGHGISKNPSVALPEEVENIKWISFVDNEKIELPECKKNFPEVTTLLVRKTKGKVQVSEEFLQGFPALRVLIYDEPFFQYSIYDIREPTEWNFSKVSTHLTELRALILSLFQGIVDELPCGGKIIVLNLSGSLLYNLPIEIEKQTNLKVLDLSHTRGLRSIKAEVILNLSALEVLDMRCSAYRWHTKRRSEPKEVVLQDLRELESLKKVFLDLADVEATYAECSWMERLESFGLSYGSLGIDSEDKFISIEEVKDTKVGSLILHAKKLRLVGVNLKEIFSSFNPTDLANSKLKSLYIRNCLFLEELTGPVPKYSSLLKVEFLKLERDEQVRSLNQIAIAIGTSTFPNLREVEINGCSKLENVFSCDYPDMALPELLEIFVCDCRNMTEVFHCDPTKTHAFVSKLKHLDLRHVRNLQRLCSCKSCDQLQSLEILNVWQCPKLKKLPRMTSIKEIRGKEEWWNELEWDSQDTKSHMTRYLLG